MTGANVAAARECALEAGLRELSELEPSAEPRKRSWPRKRGGGWAIVRAAWEAVEGSDLTPGERLNFLALAAFAKTVWRLRVLCHKWNRVLTILTALDI